jgi:hypothetical protein
MEERTFRISGRVVDQNNQGVKGLRIEAWDKDRIRNDLVGEYITEGDGTFRIDFQESYFQEVFGDQRPDLFFKVYDNDKLIHSTENSVLWNVETGREVIMIEKYLAHTLLGQRVATQPLPLALSLARSLTARRESARSR